VYRQREIRVKSTWTNQGIMNESWKRLLSILYVGRVQLERKRFAESTIRKRNIIIVIVNWIRQIRVHLTYNCYYLHNKLKISACSSKSSRSTRTWELKVKACCFHNYAKRIFTAERNWRRTVWIWSRSVQSWASKAGPFCKNENERYASHSLCPNFARN
jgi:hypothetical protein